MLHSGTTMLVTLQLLPIMEKVTAAGLLGYVTIYWEGYCSAVLVRSYIP
jgi:hypothetical protein